MGEIGFTSDFVVSFGLSNKHAVTLPEKQGVKLLLGGCE
jgi:hypothetical protein